MISTSTAHSHTKSLSTQTKKKEKNLSKSLHALQILTKLSPKFVRLCAVEVHIMAKLQGSYAILIKGEVKAKIKNFTSCSLRGAESNGLGPRKLRLSLPS